DIFGGFLLNKRSGCARCRTRVSDPPVSDPPESLLCGTRACRRGHPAGGFLEAVRPAELLAETLHAPGGVNELLLAGEERMAVGANIHIYFRQRAARRERVPARAVDGAGLVFRVRLGFHGKLLSDDPRRAESVT